MGDCLIWIDGIFDISNWINIPDFSDQMTDGDQHHGLGYDQSSGLCWV